MKKKTNLFEGVSEEEQKSNKAVEHQKQSFSILAQFKQGGTLFGKWAFLYSEAFPKEENITLKLKLTTIPLQYNNNLKEQQFPEKYKNENLDFFYGKKNQYIKNPGKIEHQNENGLQNWCTLIGVCSDEELQHSPNIKDQWAQTGNQICLKCYKEPHMKHQFLNLGKKNWMGSILGDGIILNILINVKNNVLQISDINNEVILQNSYCFENYEKWRFLIATHTASNIKIQIQK